MFHGFYSSLLTSLYTGATSGFCPTLIPWEGKECCFSSVLWRNFGRHDVSHIPLLPSSPFKCFVWWGTGEPRYVSCVQHLVNSICVRAYFSRVHSGGLFHPGSVVLEDTVFLWQFAWFQIPGFSQKSLRMQMFFPRWLIQDDCPWS